MTEESIKQKKQEEVNEEMTSPENQNLSENQTEKQETPEESKEEGFNGQEEKKNDSRESEETEIPTQEEKTLEDTKEETTPEETSHEEETSKPEEKEVEESKETESDDVENQALKEEKEVEELTKPSPEPLEDFDWDAIHKKADDYPASKREELEQIYNDTLSTVQEKEVVDGTVIAKTARDVVINIGYKSEGIVSLNEFRYNPDLKVGDKVEVYVENKEDKSGQLVLSHKKARALKSWDRVNEALEKDEIIKGYIKCRTKGGMIVDVFGIEAFLPGSQIDVKPIRDYDIYVGKTMEFKVVKINHEYKNVVVSHKALIEAELEQQKKEIIAKLEKGQILEGTVKNITSYGVFVDLGGVDGLIHITDLSWGRVNHPEEIVQLDQKLNVAILDFDDEKKRIALGLKQLTKHPWDSLDPNLKVGDKVKGKVVVMADYGAFVEIAPGVEGLIHVSEMSWSQHLRSAQEFLKVGDEVEAVILTLDREERKMSLGMKQLRPDPWDKIEEKYPVNSKHTAKVRNFTNFGVFVEIEEGVDGLIHISDLSWTKKIKHPAEFTAIGEDIEVVVLEIDKENRRLSLGHKQLEENPWDVFETIFGVDTIHEGTIITMLDKGAVVSLPYGVEGFCATRHLQKEDGTMAKVDEKLSFKVIEFSKSAKRIILSHARIHEDKRKAEELASRKAKQATASQQQKKSQKKVKLNLEKTTLGDITDLAALKSKLEIGEEEKAAVEPAKEQKEQKKQEKEQKQVKEQKEAKKEEQKEAKEEEKKKEVKEEEEKKEKQQDTTVKAENKEKDKQEENKSEENKEESK